MVEKTEEAGFLGRKHRKIRIGEDIGEMFVGRLCLLKCSDARSSAQTVVELSLLDVFPQFKTLEAILNHLHGKKVTIRDRNTELAADVINHVFGTDVDPSQKSVDAVEFYNNWLTNCVRYLRDGDAYDFAACVESTEVAEVHGLACIRLTVTPAKLADTLAENIRKYVELIPKLMAMVAHVGTSALPRVDVNKEIEIVRQYIHERTELTGERELSFDLSQIPFRHLVSFDEDGFTMSTPGTSGPRDKVCVPLFLEINGDIDVTNLSIPSDPLEIYDVEVRYSIRKPASANVYHIATKGLSPQTRAMLSQHELAVYDRIHRELSKHFVFGGKPNLENSFGELAAWLIRKVAYCLEDPSFLKAKAVQWLSDHASENYKQFEDNFFLPEIHEKLRDTFGLRVVKKPEGFRGEVDINFDQTIPVELKVREGTRQSLADDAVNAKFPGTGQAAAYAAVSRLGFVLILDLPSGTEEIINLDRCVKVITREFEPQDPFPTCIVVFIFHCHHPRPSSLPS